MTTIDNYAFARCSSVTDINCYANPDALTWVADEEAFMPGKATKCHVMSDKIAAYRNKFPDVNVTFIGDLATGIESLTADTNDGAWYTLDGVKLDGEPTTPGVYVKDGKKVMIK